MYVGRQAGRQEDRYVFICIHTHTRASCSMYHLFGTSSVHAGRHLAFLAITCPTMLAQIFWSVYLNVCEKIVYVQKIISDTITSSVLGMWF